MGNQKKAFRPEEVKKVSCTERKVSMVIEKCTTLGASFFWLSGVKLLFVALH